MRAMDGDYLTCGQCLKQFPLQRITLFIQHKRVDCVGDRGIPYEERDLKCFYCPKGFISAWGLLVHVQITHSLQIFVEHTPMSSKQQKQQHSNDVTELHPKQTMENAISNRNSDTAQDVPTMEDCLKAKDVPTMEENDCFTAKDVPTMKENDCFTVKDVPTMKENDCFTVKDVPTMKENDCFTVKDVPTMKENDCFTVKDVPTMEDNVCLTSKDVPTMEDIDNITAKDVPTMENKECIIAKDVPTMEDKECIIAKDVPTMENKECITNKDVPTMENKECIIAKDVPTMEDKDCITNKDVPTAEAMCVFLNEDKDNSLDYEHNKNASKGARKIDVRGIYSINHKKYNEKYFSNEIFKDSLDSHFKPSPLDAESIIPTMIRLERSVEVNKNAITNLPVISVERDLVSEHDASCVKSSLSTFPKGVQELSKPPPLVSDLPVSTDIGLDVRKGVSTPENTSGIAPKISQSDGDCCDNQGCGITVIPGTHQDLQKCCNAVVPKKRKRHMELKHMPFSWSSSRYARMRMLKRSFISASKSRTFSHSGQLPSSTIFIDVEPDTNTDRGQMSCHQQDASTDVPMENTSTSTTNMTNHPLKRYPTGHESRAKSLILQPGAVYSIPFSYSGSLSGTSTSIPISIQAQISDSNSVISRSLPNNKDRHYKDLESKSHETEVVNLNEKMNDSELRRRKYPTSKPFQCDTCPMAFNQRIHLKKHTSKHTGIKPYKCDECDYSTVERSHLKVHIRIHTGEKPFKCTYCEYATAQNSTLKIHLKRHHGGKLFTCDSCDKTFTQIEQLKGHKSDHPL